VFHEWLFREKGKISDSEVSQILILYAVTGIIIPVKRRALPRKTEQFLKTPLLISQHGLAGWLRDPFFANRSGRLGHFDTSFEISNRHYQPTFFVSPLWNLGKVPFSDAAARIIIPIKSRIGSKHDGAIFGNAGVDIGASRLAILD
jgi:hypothetical protein